MFRRKWEWAQWSGPQRWDERLKSFLAVSLSVAVFVAMYLALKLGAAQFVAWFNGLI
jgi:hypothetical protein